jgi:Recombination endonuclease VII
MFSKARVYTLRRTYGITEAQYTSLLTRQNSCCGCCGRHKDVFKTNLCVDHNHETGEIRGLLCVHCNRYVVGRHKESTLLHSAAAYLDNEYTGWFVPPKAKKRRKKKK